MGTSLLVVIMTIDFICAMMASGEKFFGLPGVYLFSVADLLGDSERSKQNSPQVAITIWGLY